MEPKIHPWIFGFLTRILLCKILAWLLLRIRAEHLFRAEWRSKTKTCFGTMPNAVMKQKWASASCRMAFQGKNVLRHRAEGHSKAKMGFGIVPNGVLKQKRASAPCRMPL